MKTSRKPQRGYTTVELLIALAIFAIGVTGVASMQKVTASSNSHAKALAIATYIAQSWQDKLAIDATRWLTAGPSTSMDLNSASTVWLKDLAVGANSGAWTLPNYIAAASFGPNFGALGQPLNTAAADTEKQTVFCTHVRVTPILTLGPGSGLLRVDVRVFWPRQGYPWNSGAAYCAAAADITNIGASESNFHFVYSSSAIRPTPKAAE